MNLYEHRNAYNSEALNEDNEQQKKTEALISSNKALQEMDTLESQEFQRLENLLLKKSLAISNENFKTLSEEQSAKLSALRKFLLQIAGQVKSLSNSNAVLAAGFDQTIQSQLDTALVPRLNGLADSLTKSTAAANKSLHELQQRSRAYYQHRQNIDLAILIMTVCSFCMSTAALLKVFHS